jgi:hypothetical protein
VKSVCSIWLSFWVRHLYVLLPLNRFVSFSNNVLLLKFSSFSSKRWLSICANRSNCSALSSMGRGILTSYTFSSNCTLKISSVYFSIRSIVSDILLLSFIEPDFVDISDCLELSFGWLIWLLANDVLSLTKATGCLSMTSLLVQKSNEASSLIVGLTLYPLVQLSMIDLISI